MRLIMDEIEYKNKDTSPKLIICVKYKNSYSNIRESFQTEPFQTNLETILFYKKTRSIFDFQMILDDLKPKYVIFFDIDLTLIRHACIFKISNPGHPLRCYTITHSGGIDANLLSIQDHFELDQLELVNTLRLRPTPKSTQRPIKLIFFDLETTGIKRDAAIIEIAAWAQDIDNVSVPENFDTAIKSEDIFYTLMMPDKRMTPGASNVNGIRKCGVSKLSVRGKIHDNVASVESALTNFLNWLSKYQPCDICLVAHNCYKYDAPVLSNQLSRVNLTHPFLEKVKYFGDTYHSLKQAYPKKKLKLTTLGSETIPNWSSYAKHAHSALFDVWVMIKVLNNFNYNLTVENMKPVNAVILSSGSVKLQNEVCEAETAGFHELVNRGVLTVNTASFMTHNQITFNQLESTSRYQGQKELQKLLSGAFQTPADELSTITKIREYFY